MNLQSALVVLGLIVLVYVLVASYLKGPIEIFKQTPYLHGLISASSQFWSSVRFKKVSRASDGAPALVSASDFRLAPDPTAELGDNRFTESRSSVNVRRARSYSDKDHQKFQRILKIDYWVRVPGTELVNCHDVLAIFRGHELDFESPHRIHGQIYPRNVWTDLEEATNTDRLSDLIVSVQIAGRHGLVTLSELTRTNNLVYELSEKLDRKLQFDMTIEDALIEAQLLDEFCKLHDVLVIVNIIAKEGQQFLGKDILEVADHSGMKVGDMGMFHFSDPQSSEISFSMGNRFEPGELMLNGTDPLSTTGVMLFMSIPLVSDPLGVFDKMIAVAQYATSELAGDLQDPDGGTIDQIGIEKIRQQVIDIGEVFHRVGILPGSEEALRLF